MKSASIRTAYGGPSLRLGSPFGIPLRLHWSFFGLVGLVWIMSGAALSTLAFLGSLFVSVMVHELGHGLMAQRLGVKVQEIAFWSLGGMTRMEVPEDAELEMKIAFAGPAINFIVALVCLPASFLLYDINGVTDSFASPMPLFTFGLLNLLLGTFNLLPAFPMDGGRILRAWYAREHDWLEATERAVKIGRWVALGTILLALAFGAQAKFLCMLPIIAAFLYVAGGRELMQIRLRKTGSPFKSGGIQFRVWQPGSEPPNEPNEGSPTLQGEPGASRGFSDSDVEEMERHKGKWTDD